MTFEAIEQVAMHREPEPDGATIADITAYWALRGLYTEYRVGNVDKELGKEIKIRIRAAYEKIAFAERIEDDFMNRARELAKIPPNDGQCKWCENTRRAITGLKIKEVISYGDDN